MKKIEKHIHNFLIYLAIIIFLIISMFPIYWLFTLSLKLPHEAFSLPPTWIFKPTLENYASTFLYGPFSRYLINSIVVALSNTGLSVMAGSLAAYSLARFNFRGKKLSLLAVLIAPTIPPIALAIPLYMVYNDYGLIDTKFSLILTYFIFNLPFVVWIMYGFFQEIPESLEESAMLDGCSRLGAMWRIALPLVAPGLAAASIICIIYSWNEFLYAMIFTGTSAKTMPVAITGFITSRGVYWSKVAACGSLVILPVFLFTLFVQKHLIKGLSLGAVKE